MCTAILTAQLWQGQELHNEGRGKARTWAENPLHAQTDVWQLKNSLQVRKSLSIFLFKMSVLNTNYNSMYLSVNSYLVGTLELQEAHCERKLLWWCYSHTLKCCISVRHHVIFVFFLFFFLPKWNRSWKCKVPHQRLLWDNGQITETLRKELMQKIFIKSSISIKASAYPWSWAELYCHHL